jgi:hypothetical protein
MARIGVVTRFLLSLMFRSLIEIVLKFLRAAGMAQLPQRLGFDLANAFSGDAKLAPYLL